MELGTEVDTPADILNKSNNIVLRNKELREADTDEINNNVKLFNRYGFLFLNYTIKYILFVSNSGFILGAGNSTLPTA